MSRPLLCGMSRLTLPGSTSGRCCCCCCWRSGVLDLPGCARPDSLFELPAAAAARGRAAASAGVAGRRLEGLSAAAAGPSAVGVAARRRLAAPGAAGGLPLLGGEAPSDSCDPSLPAACCFCLASA